MNVYRFYFGAGIFVLATAVWITVMDSASSRQADNPLVLGVFPRRHPSITMEMFTPMARYLSGRLKRRVVLESAPDFDTFWSRLRNKRYDLVHYNQYHYIRSRRELGYRVILMNEERGFSTISAAFVVRRDSGVNRLSDLRGKLVLFGGGQKAMQSYIFATYLLRQAGLNAGDYRYRFEDNPPTAIVAAYHGLWDAVAAAAGNYSLELPVVAKQVNPRDLKYLAVGEAYAHLPWAVKQDMRVALREQIQSAMLELNDSEEGKKILKKAKLSGLHPARDKDYDPHREIVKVVLGEVY